MANEPQIFGSKNESLAAEYLLNQGYAIIARNYRTPVGEIDIVADHKGTVVFVEVKSRRTQRYGPAKYAVTRQKQQKLSKTALWYLKSTRQLHKKARFDVVAIDNYPNATHIELIQNAFDLTNRY
jgi:putative endonuclease